MEKQILPTKRNRMTGHLDRFIAATRKTENDYQKWATEVARKMHINKFLPLVVFSPPSIQEL